MTVVMPLIVGVLGAAIGSFLNVVIHRVPRGLSVVSPPSACPSCAAPIRPGDNIPVLSWLLLRGRCRSCAAPIAARYAVVELATALSFAGLAALVAPRILAATTPADVAAAVLELVALLWFAGISIALTAIDLETHRLPDRIVLPSYAVLAVLLGSAALLTGAGEAAGRAAAGAGILFIFYLALALISPRGMGMGDVKLAGVIGLVLGWVGWEALAVGALGAFLLGGLAALVLIAARRARRTTGIPFGPWMLGGAWMGILLGEPIARGYLALFGLD
ncbi:prepilin peptidase [Microcella frigidaquae]|uniref:Prepilin leader peptidase/N-methyltransferase n=1 Tax=Microcella frigidaquae TaxID=424758 RepID=A0A840XLT6_9MICO|nr:A24 family peptidase [Microcella frigidaquae]MBB5617807.1 leader peptidase (prepilin peptidase)/N-methyltransferase [Microcella frigidaquae]NHN45479.1 prepilin peptidase [Microcella frigidaquae]